MLELDPTEKNLDACQFTPIKAENASGVHHLDCITHVGSRRLTPRTWVSLAPPRHGRSTGDSIDCFSCPNPSNRLDPWWGTVPILSVVVAFLVSINAL